MRARGESGGRAAPIFNKSVLCVSARVRARGESGGRAAPIFNKSVLCVSARVRARGESGGRAAPIFNKERALREPGGGSAPILKIAVAGALGRMGRETCATVDRASDLTLVGGFDRSDTGKELQTVLGLSRPSGLLYSDVDAFYDEAKPDVVVDFTIYPVSLDLARGAVERKISPVIGATGWMPEDEVAFADLCDEQGVGAAIVPNFAIGAVLMMRFAEEAARYFPTAEVIELHHDGKLDKPSGTARATAKRIAVASGRSEVPTHSVRLRGLVAHQEVLFGGEGETLTIRHDSLARSSFMVGVLRAIRGVREKRGLVLGLEAFLGESA